jgi:hypothetical protein
MEKAKIQLQKLDYEAAKLIYPTVTVTHMKTNAGIRRKTKAAAFI